MSDVHEVTDSVKALPVSKLFEDKHVDLELTQLTESMDGKVPITVSDINRPGLAMAGFVENFLAERIQVIGQTEVALLSSLSEEARTVSELSGTADAREGLAAVIERRKPKFTGR